MKKNENSITKHLPLDKEFRIGDIANKVYPDRQKLVMICCKITRSVLHLVEAGEGRPLKAIETAEGWAKGEVDIDKIIEATAAAAETAYAACADADIRVAYVKLAEIADLIRSEINWKWIPQ